MGAGSSAQFAGKIKEASQDEVSAVVSGLTAEQRTQLQAALGGGEAEKAAPAEAPAEAAAPAEGAAPFLTQAFLTQAFLTQTMTQAFLMAISGEDVDPDDLQKEINEAMEKCREFLGKSFDHHDKKGNGVLDKEEASAFFEHLLEANGAMFQNIVEVEMRIPIEAMIKDFKASKDLSDEEKAKAIAGMKEGLQETINEQKAATAKQVEEYKANKAERDAAAFKVVDTSGDGTMQREEFLDALKFGSEKNGLLMEAIGIQMG